MSLSVGDRIAARRQELGWTQIQLAHAAGLTPSAISLFESGKRKPSFDALRRLAEALRVPADYLMGDNTDPRYDMTLDPRWDRLQQAFVLLDESGRDQLIEMAMLLVARRGGGVWIPAAEEESRAAARTLVEQLGIQRPPVDPFLITPLLGVSVRLVALVTDYEAVVDASVEPPLILLAREPADGSRPLGVHRLRFTLAHALAHVVLAHHRGRIHTCRPLQAAGVSGDLALADDEAQASAFGAELLVPEPMLKAELTRLQTEPKPGMSAALEIARRFHVSVPVGVLQYARCVEEPCAAILTEGGRVRIVAQSSAFPWRMRPEPPENALFRTTQGLQGIQRRICTAAEWVEGEEDLQFQEEAYHYWLAAEQSVTLLTLLDQPSVRRANSSQETTGSGLDRSQD